MKRWRIVCDIGGTNVRIGRGFGEGPICDVVIKPTASLRRLEAEIGSYAARGADPHHWEGVAIAAAGPVQDGGVRLTNAALKINAAQLASSLGKPVRIVNDLEAVAWGLPGLTRADVLALCEVELPLEGPRLVINAGTGFGAALLVETQAGHHVMGCEPGHMKLASGFGLNSEAVAVATSVEDVLSGLALSNKKTLASFWRWPGAGAEQQARSDVFACALESASGRSFVANFSALLGQVCGDLVLATGAWGGVYTCGSVFAAWAAHGDRDLFAQHFREKGPMSDRMLRVGVSHITAVHPALKGLAALPL